MQTDRLPPQAIEAEESILAYCLLYDPSDVLDTISPDDFYKTTHKEIFKAISNLKKQDVTPELVTVVNELRKSESLERVGGAAYISRLVDAIPVSISPKDHARIIKDKSILRQVIARVNEISQSCFESQDAESTLDDAQKSICAIDYDVNERSVSVVGDVLDDVITDLERRQSGDVTGIPTGYGKLDLLLGGMQRGDSIIIGGRPSMGKTSFAMSMVKNIAVDNGIPCAVFSLEMSKKQLTRHLISQIARVDGGRFLNAILTPNDWERITLASDKLSKAPVHIDDRSGLHYMQVRRTLRKLVKKSKIKIAFIDYMGLMTGDKDGGRIGEVSSISRAMKQMAKEFEIPVVTLCQLSRKCEERADKRPVLSDLRDCVTADTQVTKSDGSIVEVADIVGHTPIVESYNGFCSGSRLADKVWEVGERDCFKITFTSGREFIGTKKHRLLGYKRWVRIESLRCGDRLARLRKLREPNDPVIYDEAVVGMVGQLIGDGSYIKGQPMRYTTACEFNARAVENGAAILGSTTKRYPGRGNWLQILISNNGNRWHASGVGLFLKNLGIFGQRSGEKRVPANFFRMPNHLVAVLVRNLWATDGCIHRHKNGRWFFNFSSKSRMLCVDISNLMLRFGIQTRITRSDSSNCWILNIFGKHRETYCREIGGFGKDKNRCDLFLSECGRTKNTNVDTMPIDFWNDVKSEMGVIGVSYRELCRRLGKAYNGSAMWRYSPSFKRAIEVADALNSDFLRDKINDELFWDTIKKITPIGKQTVYDISVPVTNSWVSGSLISHNSGEIEQDADVVMFVYRDEMYCDDDNNPNRGTAEILIRKHREGTTGTVHMAFLSKYRRFEELGYEN